ncbi:MAG: hypothetical protein ACOYXW_07190 [Actinomycetota bacterium]
MTEETRAGRLVALAVAAFVLFNYPILGLFDVEALVLGVPLVWLYVFAVWAALVVAVGLTVRGR